MVDEKEPKQQYILWTDDSRESIEAKALLRKRKLKFQEIPITEAKPSDYIDDWTKAPTLQTETGRYIKLSAINAFFEDGLFNPDNGQFLDRIKAGDAPGLWPRWSRRHSCS